MINYCFIFFPFPSHIYIASFIVLMHIFVKILYTFHVCARACTHTISLSRCVCVRARFFLFFFLLFFHSSVLLLLVTVFYSLPFARQIARLNCHSLCHIITFEYVFINVLEIVIIPSDADKCAPLALIMLDAKICWFTQKWNKDTSCIKLKAHPVRVHLRYILLCWKHGECVSARASFFSLALSLSIWYFSAFWVLHFIRLTLRVLWMEHFSRIIYVPMVVLSVKNFSANVHLNSGFFHCGTLSSTHTKKNVFMTIFSYGWQQFFFSFLLTFASPYVVCWQRNSVAKQIRWFCVWICIQFSLV